MAWDWMHIVFLSMLWVGMVYLSLFLDSCSPGEGVWSSVILIDITAGATWHADEIDVSRRNKQKSNLVRLCPRRQKIRST